MYVVTGSIAATGKINATLAWQAPNAANPSGPSIEVVLDGSGTSVRVVLQVAYATGAVRVTSDSLPGPFTGSGGRASWDTANQRGVIEVDGAVSYQGQSVMLNGKLEIEAAP